ncbi:MAG: DUF2599 domain-containing protein [Mycobacterium sp.]
MIALPVVPAATAEAVSGPYIDHAAWARYSDLSSLRVYPTSVGREVAGQFGKSPAESERAWLEVLALVPEADTPGMRAQFVCHWHFAELAEPGKASWNLEAWRPSVDEDVMVASRCNPGGAEEAV